VKIELETTYISGNAKRCAFFRWIPRFF